MRVAGQVRVKVPREEAFKILTNPDALSRCTPGLEAMEIVEPGRRFRGAGVVGVGAVRIHFTTEIEWLDLSPPRGARMRMVCRARRRTIDIGSHFELTDGRDGWTDMTWSADIELHGPLAGLAAPFLRPAALKIAGEFLECIRKRIEGAAATGGS